MTFFAKRNKTSKYPLLWHMLDVATAFEYLWENIISDKVKERIADSCKTNTKKTGKLLSFIAGLHDIGKATTYFQKNVLDGVGAKDADQNHALMSGKFLLKKHEFSGLKKFAPYIAFHHSNIYAVNDLQRNIREQDKESQDKTFVQFCEVMDVKYSELQTIQIESEHPSWMLIFSGLLSFSDWLVSTEKYWLNQDYCGLEGADLKKAISTSIREYLENEQILRTTPLPEAKEDVFDKFFSHITDFIPRPLQTIINDKFTSDEQSLTIIEAPTGEGKTEAALALAAKQMQSGISKGVFVAMPTQATSNMLYDRFNDFLDSGFGKSTISNLVHGNSYSSEKFKAANKQFEELHGAEFTTYSEDGEEIDQTLISDWFLNKKLALISQFGVGTVDQTLYSVLNVKYFFLRLFGLAGKTVIFDEVHAYDVCMKEITCRLITWLKEIGSSVIILSATLPQSMKEELMQAWNKKAKVQSDKYPLISQVVGDFPEVQEETFDVDKKNKSKKVKINFCDKADKLDELADDVLQLAKPNSHIAVLLNTVCRTQKFYKLLKEKINEDKVELSIFHARFTQHDRSIKEEKAIKDFGKKREETDNAKIIIATQVIEQSLDLDFDIMFSDIAPVDMLLQRAGRVHRHDRDDRALGLKEPQLVILTPEITEALPKFKNAGIYDDILLWRTYYKLKTMPLWDFSENHLYRDLVESVYDEKSAVLEKAGLSEGDLVRVEVMMLKRDNESANWSIGGMNQIIPEPEEIEEYFIEAENPVAEQDSEKSKKGITANTRCSNEYPTQIVLIYKKENGDKDIYSWDNNFETLIYLDSYIQKQELMKHTVGTTKKELIKELYLRRELYLKEGLLKNDLFKNYLLWINPHEETEINYRYYKEIGLFKNED